MEKVITLADLEKILDGSLSKEQADALTESLLLGDLELNTASLDRNKTPRAIQALGEESLMLAKKFTITASLLGFEPDDELKALVNQETDRQPARLAAASLLPAAFDVSGFPEFRNTIEEVVLGAPEKDGGSRAASIAIGGEKTMPYFFGAEMKNRNVVTMDVFDMPVSLAKSVRSNYEDVMTDPAAWAKKVVRDFGADMVTIHLISTDPAISATSPKDAAKTVEDVLQAVDVPIVIGGSGNPATDPEVLEKAAEAASGERVLLASANPNMDYVRIAKAAKTHGHAILSWTQMDINAQKELNRKLIRQCGMRREDIIMDPTTAALGYGLDYAYSNMERIRMAGLSGDTELAFPISSGTTNAWGAREAWMIASPLEQDSDWGNREFRGPIWEAVTGLSLALAGNDLFMMMHPAAVRLLKNIMKTLWEKAEKTNGHDSEKEDEWLTAAF